MYKDIERHTMIRIYKTYQKIADRKYPNCKTLAEEYEINVRTVQRDIEAMKYSMDLPLLFDKKKNGYYFEDTNKSQLPPIQISESELVSFFLLQKIIPNYGGKLREAYQNLAKKIEMLSSKQMSLSPKELSNMFSCKYGHERLSANPEAYELIEKAIMLNTKIKMRYVSNNKEETRIVDPYHLKFVYAEWYLYGFCHLRKEIRTFSLSRIKKLKLLKTTFQTPKDLNLSEMFSSAWMLITGEPIDIELEFAGDTEWVQERNWHQSQKFQKDNNGNLRMSLQVTDSLEIRSWILGLGSNVKVIKPTVIRNFVREEAEKILNLN